MYERICIGRCCNNGDGGGQVETDKINSKLIYFVMGHGGSGVALQGERGPSGARGLKVKL